MREKIIKSDLKNKKYVVVNRDENSSLELIIDKYNYMVDTLKINSNKILVMALNRARTERIRQGLEYKQLSSINIGSYFSFVQKELKKFWPLVLDSCERIGVNRVAPVFMTFEASQNLMTKLVLYFREKGMLNSITMEEEELAQKMLSNLSVLAFSNENYQLYAKKMQKFNFLDEDREEEVYEELNKLINLYVDRVLNQGTLDYALAVYLYNNYLLNNQQYLSYLKESYDYVIVEAGNLASPSQVDLIETLEAYVEELCIFYNPNGSYGVYLQNESYAREKFLDGYMNLDLNSELREGLKELEGNLLYDKSYEIKIESIEKRLEFDFNIEANKALLKDLKVLLDQRGSLEGVAIILPSRDIALEYILSVFSKKHNITINNLNKTERIIDNEYINALTTFATLYYNYEEVKINVDEMKVFISIFLEVDLIKASLFATWLDEKGKLNKLERVEDKYLLAKLGEEFLDKYNDLVDFLGELSHLDLNLDEFLKEIYLKYYLDMDKGREVVKECKGLIDSAKNFIDVISYFDSIKDVNLEFIKFVRNGAKESENIYDIKDKLENKGLVIASPISYLNYGFQREVVFLLDLGNNLWLMNNVNFLQNPYILTKGWNKKQKFTIERNEEERLFALKNLIYYLFYTYSDKLILYSYKYSSLGIEKTSQFLDILRY